MQLHQLSPKTKIKREKRVGRGGKRGTTSGRGTKGQEARAGAKIRPAIRDVIKKLPKARGYRFRSFQKRPLILRLGALSRNFNRGETVTPETLLKKGLIGKIKGRRQKIKILGSSPLDKKLNFQGLVFSKSARLRVQEAGGEIKNRKF